MLPQIIYAYLKVDSRLGKNRWKCSAHEGFTGSDVCCWRDAEFCPFLSPEPLSNARAHLRSPLWHRQCSRFDGCTARVWFSPRSPLSSVKPSWLSLRRRSKPWLMSLIFCFRSVCFLCSSGSLVSPSSGEITFLCVSVDGNRKKHRGY